MHIKRHVYFGQLIARKRERVQDSTLFNLPELTHNALDEKNRATGRPRSHGRRSYSWLCHCKWGKPKDCPGIVDYGLHAFGQVGLELGQVNRSLLIVLFLKWILRCWYACFDEGSEGFVFWLVCLRLYHSHTHNHTQSFTHTRTRVLIHWHSHTDAQILV